MSTLAATRLVGPRIWPALRKEYFDAGRLRDRSASRRRLMPLSSLRRTFAAIVAMTCLSCLKRYVAREVYPYIRG